MTRVIDFYFDFVSPYAYLAHARLPVLADEYGYAIAYHPIDVAQAKLGVGNTGPSTRQMPIKRRYIQADLKRWADHYGIPYKLPSNHDSRRLNILAFLAIDRGCAREFLHTAWEPLWGHGGAMNDEGLLRDIVARMGWTWDAVRAFEDSGDGERRYAQSTAQATERGVFGVPTMLIGDEMWWGNDRLGFLESYLKEKAT